MSGGQQPRTDKWKPVWYRRYRGAAYLGALAAMAWTVAMVLPIPPFSNLPPIIAQGGPGIWLVLGYVLFMVVGVGGFGALSAFLTTVELHERRIIDPRTMWPALILLSVGVVGSCLLLGAAGVVGGYAEISGSLSEKSVESMLTPYVYPSVTFTLVAVVGAGLAVLSLVRARWPQP